MNKNEFIAQFVHPRITGGGSGENERTACGGTNASYSSRFQAISIDAKNANVALNSARNLLLKLNFYLIDIGNIFFVSLRSRNLIVGDAISY
jgi:hypothetical protein